LELAIVFGILATLLFVMIDLAVINGWNTRESTLIGIARICFALQYYFLYLFFESGLNARPWTPRLSVMTFLVGGSIGFILISVVTPDQYVDWVRFLGDTYRSGFGFAVFSFGVYYFIMLQKITKEVSAFVQTLGTLLVAISFVIQLYATPYLGGDNIDSIQGVSDIFAIIGLFTFVIFYIFKPELAMRIPVQTFEILVYSKTGINFHSVLVSTRGIETQDNYEDRAFLMSSLSAAITSFLKSATGSQRELEAIQSTDRVVIFNLGEIHISLVAEAVTEVMIDSLRDLRMEYESLIPEEQFAKLSQEPLEREAFDRLILKHFPYLEVEAVH
jgi:hypothetical protein